MTILSSWWINGVISQTIYVGIIGPLIAIGPPALYYYYTEVLQIPEIRFGDITYRVAPMYFPANYNPSDDDIPEISLPHVARIAVFITVDIINEGRATAENCKIEVANSSVQYSARWDMVSNPEKYDLLPGESQESHLGKVFLTTDFFFMKRNWFDDLDHVLQTLFKSKSKLPQKQIEVEFGSTVVTPPGNPQGIVEIQTRDNQLVSDDNIRPAIYRPAEQPPERQDRSIRGGWWGEELSSGKIGFQIRALAEDYRTDFDDKGEFEFPQDIIRSILKSDEDMCWSNEWTDKDYSEFKQDLVNALADWYRR